MLSSDNTGAGQLSGEILADLDGVPDQRCPEAGGIVNKQLRPRVTAEDRVLHAALGCRDLGALAIPVEPVGTHLPAELHQTWADPDCNLITV